SCCGTAGDFPDTSLASCGCPSLSFPFPVSGPAFPEDVSLFFLWDFSSLLFSISVLICAASVTEANLNRSTIRLIRGASSSLTTTSTIPSMLPFGLRTAQYKIPYRFASVTNCFRSLSFTEYTVSGFPERTRVSSLARPLVFFCSFKTAYKSTASCFAPAPVIFKAASPTSSDIRTTWSAASPDVFMAYFLLSLFLFLPHNFYLLTDPSGTCGDPVTKHHLPSKFPDPGSQAGNLCFHFRQMFLVFDTAALIPQPLALL